MFHFKQFSISDEISAMKIGTDGVMLGAWAIQNAEPRNILDVGAGTGLIALMLAQRFPGAHITAIEINQDAAQEARDNILQSPWNDRIEVVNADFNSYRPEMPIDTIVSNPPFFDEMILSPDAHRTAARHESSLTLDNLICRASDTLPPGGRMAFIAPARRSDDLIYKCAMNHLDIERITTVSSKPCTQHLRVMLQAVKGISHDFTSDHIDIRAQNGVHYSDAYKSLTEKFYLPETFTSKK